MNKPILCLDFDGVIHLYTSSWTDEVTISDGMTVGFWEWAIEADKLFQLGIYSSRSKSREGRLAMTAWLAKELDQWWMNWGQHKLPEPPQIYFEFYEQKPPAFLTIDDRALTFKGSWPMLDPTELRNFKPWNKT